MIVYDDRFYDFIDATSQIETLASNPGWAQGPVWAGALNSLLFSDVAADYEDQVLYLHGSQAQSGRGWFTRHDLLIYTLNP